MHSIRIPIHGFVEFNDWERDIINHPVFQRLRRIRQLAFSEHVYPGSVHTRFEHSLGVMHVATQMYDRVFSKHESCLVDRFKLKRAAYNGRVLVRLAALLHDVGHAPFSHTGEDVMPVRDEKTGARFDHEDYSCELIAHEMRDVIDDHPANRKQFNIKAQD
ncbi:MAG: HD domain-containing protein, partial [Planctomycetota bacterium]